MFAVQQDLGRFFKHSGIYGFGNALNRIGAFVLLPIYTNYLSVSEYGALELFYAIAAVVSGLLSVGIAHATLRFYFEYREESERKAVVSTNLIASLAISAAGVLPLAYWAEDIGSYVLGKPAMGLAIWVILATLVLELSSQISLAYLRAREYSVFFIAVSLAKLVMQVAVNAVLLIAYEAGVFGVLAGNLAAVALGWAVLTVFTVLHCGLRFDVGKLMPVLRYSFPFLLSTIAGLISLNIDRFLINNLLSLEILGLYALAMKFSRLLNDLIGEPFNRAYGAFRFSIMHQDNAAEIQARIVLYLFAAGCLAALGLAYFTGDILRVMTSQEYWSAADLVPLLALASVLKLMSYPLQTGILYAKHTRFIFYIGAVLAAVSAAGGLLLIALLGARGACLAVFVTAVVEVFLTNRISQRYFPVVYDRGRLLRVLALTAVFYLASLPLETFGARETFAFKWALLTLYGVGLVKLGTFDSDHILQIRRLLRERWRALVSTA